MSIQMKAVGNAIRLLSAAGAQYFVRCGSGEVFQTPGLVVQDDPKQKRSVRRPAGFFADLYLPVVRDMKPGGSAKFNIPDEMDPAALRSAVTAWMSTNRGANNSMSSVDKVARTVEILRLE